MTVRIYSITILFFKANNNQWPIREREGRNRFTKIPSLNIMRHSIILSLNS